MKNHFARFAPLLLRALLVAALLAVLGWQWRHLVARPPVYTPQEITINLPPGGSLVLGKNELAAGQAERDHLGLRRDPAGNWWLSLRSQIRKVLVKRQGSEAHLGELALTEGLRFGFNRADFVVHRLEKEKGWLGKTRLSLADGAGRVWTYDGALLKGPEDAIQAACPDSGPFSWIRLDRVRRHWNRLVPTRLSKSDPLELGGLLACGNRLPVAGVPQAAAWLSRDSEGDLVLRASTDPLSGQRQSLRFAVGSEPEKTLDEIETPLAGINGLVVGRSHYRLALESDRLRLFPEKNIQIFDRDTPPDLPSGVSWSESGLDPLKMGLHDSWRWPLPLRPAWFGGLWLLALMGAAVAIQRRRRPGDWPHSLRLVFGGGLALLGVGAFRLGPALGEGWSLALVSTALSALLLLRMRSDWLGLLSTGLFVLLAAIGLAAQQALGFAAAHTGGLRFFQSNAGLIAMAAALLVAWPPLRRLFSSLRSFEPGTVGTALMYWSVLIGGLIVCQVVLGGETGFGDFQPVEAAKFTLCLLGANALPRLLDRREARFCFGNWLRILWPVPFAFVVLVVSLLLVQDISPMLLLFAWLTGMFTAWVLARGRISYLTQAFLLILVAVAALGLWWLKADGGIDQLGRAGWSSDRLMVWLNPALHPHTGSQFQLATQLIYRGWPLDSEGGSPWGIPEIHNDFAPAFFLARFGGWGGVGLIALQTLYLFSLLALGRRCLSGIQPGDYCLRWLARFRFFTLWGGAFILAGHFMVSCSVNLGWLPVMGQPMPLLSAAGSMIVLFLFPLQVFCHEEPDGR